MSDKTFGYIYLITFPNNKIYIGQHKSKVFDEKYWGSGIVLKNAYDKYKKENCSREVLAWANSKHELNELEKMFIEEYKSNDINIGYNISKGGDGCILEGEKNGMFGKHHSESAKQKMRETIKAIWDDEDLKNKRRLTFIGNKNPNYKNGLATKELVLLKFNIKQKYNTAKNNVVVADFNKNECKFFNSIKEVCNYYNISYNALHCRNSIYYLEKYNLALMTKNIYDEITFSLYTELKDSDINIIRKYIDLKYKNHKIINNKYIYFSMNDAWKNIANDILNYGEKIAGTTEINNLMFTIVNPESFLLTKYLPVNIKYLLGELTWYWNGSNDVKFISKFSKFWNKISDDGMTSNSAYGYVIQKEFGFNQIEKIIELLSKDPNSRRAIININRANRNVIETKDEHCTISLGFNIRNGCLNMTTTMRSSDWNTGIRNDIPYFCSILIYISKRLNVKIGTYTHINYSTHIYDKDYDAVKLSLSNNYCNTKYPIMCYVDVLKLIDNASIIYDNVNKSDNAQIAILNECIEKSILCFENSDYEKYFKYLNLNIRKEC